MIAESDQARGECDNVSCTREATCGAISQGATGRYCEVMWFCRPCAEGMTKDRPLKTVQQARDICNDDPTGYADF